MSRSEDWVVAWTWEQFIQKNGTDPEILVEFPMTKVMYDTIANLYIKRLIIISCL